MGEKVTVQRLELDDRELEDYLSTAYENGSELLSLQQIPNDSGEIRIRDEPLHKFLIVLREL
jgi:hypothetical protein